MFMNEILVLFLVLVFCSAAYSQKVENNSEINESPITVNFCDLLNNTMAYSGKLIRVRALYVTEFEKSSLSSPNCPVPDYPYITWVEFDKSFKDCTKKSVRKKLNKMKEGINSDVTFVGSFETEGHFGQLDMYLTQLNVTCVENVQDAKNFKPLPDGKNN